MNSQYQPYKPHLQIFILVHQDSAYNPSLAQFIFSFLTRDIKNPLSRGLGIPVYFWNPFLYEYESNDKIINYNSANHTVVVSLIDYKMLLDSNWQGFLNQLWNEVKDLTSKHRLILVALDEQALKIASDLKNVNFIRLFDFPEENKLFFLRLSITHELCRLLRGDPIDGLIPSVKLFLSHAKKDGEIIAERVRDYIHSKTQLDSYFDSNNIPPGIDFKKDIEKNILNSCLIAFRTDAYGSREWCRREVLITKKNKCPMIVVNCLSEGEDRSFPYMGNVPVIRWDSQNNNRIHDILTLALHETLRNLYNSLFLRDFNELLEIQEKYLYWYRAPEILTCIQNIGKKINSQDDFILLYPDPPLGIEEIILLKQTLSNVRFITPTQLVENDLINNAIKEPKSIIGLSISDSPDLPINGLTKHHLLDAMIEFYRYILTSKARIAYGGDLRKGGFTQKLFDLTREYTKIEENPENRVINYLSWPYYRDLTEKEDAELIDVAVIKKIDLPEDIKEFTEKVIDKEKPEDRYLIARALTKMRKEMNNAIQCRIFIGGNITKFGGRYPGLIEEAYLALKSEKPIYLIGAFGGASKVIIEAIKGNKPKILSLEEQIKNSNYKEFVNFFNKQLIDHPQIEKEMIDYNKLLKFFQEIGKKGLNNGLNEEENNQLFNTIYIKEMVSLVLKGLSRLKLI